MTNVEMFLFTTMCMYFGFAMFCFSVGITKLVKFIKSYKKRPNLKLIDGGKKDKGPYNK